MVQIFPTFQFQTCLVHPVMPPCMRDDGISRLSPSAARGCAALLSKEELCWNRGGPKRSPAFSGPSDKPPGQEAPSLDVPDGTSTVSQAPHTGSPHCGLTRMDRQTDICSPLTRADTTIPKPSGTTGALGLPSAHPLVSDSIVHRDVRTKDLSLPALCIPGDGQLVTMVSYLLRASQALPFPASTSLTELLQPPWFHGLKVGIHWATYTGDRGCGSSASQTIPELAASPSWAPSRVVAELQGINLRMISTQTPRFILATSEAFPAAGSSVLPSSPALEVPGYCRESGLSKRVHPQHNRL